MPRPTIEELQRFWLLAYSRSSLLDANSFLEAMETENPHSIELRAMIDAAVVAYARPFSKFQVTHDLPVAPLAEIPPPTHLAEYHQDALDLRNKLIGNKDATPARRHTTTPNVVLVHIEPEAFHLHTTIISQMEAPDEKRTERALRVLRGALRGKLKAFNEGLFF